MAGKRPARRRSTVVNTGSYYTLDEIGTNPENPDEPDGVPDKYQVTVTYTATNGTVSLPKAVVTLYDSEGNYAEDGAGHLTAEQIPAATPAAGYDPDSKTWTAEEPTTSLAITEDVTFHVEWSRDSFNYTVNYLNEDGGAVLHDAETKSAEFESVITSEDEVIAINGYVYDHASVPTLTIGTNEAANVINLYYAADIERAAAMGWIKGSNGMFRPVDKITRAEVIVNRMLDRVPDADHMLPDMKTFPDNTPDMWWYADVQEATNSHEYDRAEDGVTGIWTSLLPEQDWAALEKEWATAADANMADVAPNLGGEAEKPEEETRVPETTGDGKVPETTGDGNGEN